MKPIKSLLFYIVFLFGFIFLSTSVGGPSTQPTSKPTTVKISPTTQPYLGQEVCIFGIRGLSPVDLCNIYCQALDDKIKPISNMDLLYLWDFGDGNSYLTNSSIFKHQYLSNGIYQISLTSHNTKTGTTKIIIRKIKILDQVPRPVEYIHEQIWSKWLSL